MIRRSVVLISALMLLFVGMTGWCQTESDVPEIHLIINEIEINPLGLDTDHEWVELLNPTDVAIDLNGWQISYSYPESGYILLSETPLIISPGGRYIFVYPGLRLRNGDAHVFRLMNPEGIVVEETAPFKDEANDDSTWQRFPDGGDPLFLDLWIFQKNSRNKSNS